MAPPRKPMRERLKSGHTVVISGCWEWTGNKDRDGYGVLSVGRTKQHRAHRLSFECFVGDIPEGLFVLHRCDNPCCINPQHLFVGTAKDNAIDRERKGRGNRLSGEAHPNAKVTMGDVATIRALRNQGTELKYLSEKFGISFQQVSNICNKLSWR